MGWFQRESLHPSSPFAFKVPGLWPAAPALWGALLPPGPGVYSSGPVLGWPAPGLALAEFFVFAFVWLEGRAADFFGRGLAQKWLACRRVVDG